MDLDAALLLTRRAIEAAGYYGRPLCISVCDAQGFLLAFARMDGAPVRSIEIAHAKAYSAARLGVTTTSFHERLQAQGHAAGYYCDIRLTGLPGGAVLKDSGGVAGGVGISGLAPAEDQAIADLLAGV